MDAIKYVDARLWVGLVISLTLLLGGCGSLPVGPGGTPLLGVNGYGIIPVTTDIISTHPGCQGGTYWEDTECQRGYNREVSWMNREAFRAREELARDFGRRAYDEVRYSPSTGQIVYGVDCNSAPSLFARDECYRASREGYEKALSEARGYRSQVEHGAYQRGAELARGTIRPPPPPK